MQGILSRAGDVVGRVAAGGRAVVPDADGRLAMLYADSQAKAACDELERILAGAEPGDDLPATARSLAYASPWMGRDALTEAIAAALPELDRLAAEDGSN